MSWLFGKKGEKEAKKEKEEFPELPPLPELPKLSGIKTKEIKPELPPLPSFPSSFAGEEISREAVKHAIKEPEYEMLEKFEMLEEPRTREIEEFKIRKPLPFIKTKEIKPEIGVEPVFVRIDKYNESLANFQEIKRKVLEIENLLREIREVKAREDIQLQEWEQEIQEAKVKLDRIDKTIFKKLEE